MRYHRMAPAEPRPNDPASFLEEMEKLLSAGAAARRPPNNNDQLKVSANLNYYPGTGTIFRDGDRKPLPIRGVDALIAYLQEIDQLKEPARS